MDLILIWVAKILQKTSRLLGNSGAALPGLFLEKVSPKILERRLSKIPDGIIVISGTNGKTTTTKIVYESLDHLGRRVLTNQTGSNMTRGLLSMIVSKSSLSGRLPYDIAVLEIDEAYAALLANKIPIRGALVLNIMRDQLDRFGEIDTTAKLLASLTNAANEFVVLNAEDKRVSALPVKSSAKKVYFGYSDALKSSLRNDDDWHRDTKNEKQSRISTAEYILNTSTASELEIQAGQKKYKLSANFVGAHNHSNIVAALAVLGELVDKKAWQKVVKYISEIRPAFGRGESIDLGQSQLNLLLVKNPSSFVTTINSIDFQQYGAVVVAINDAYADGRDVSWLWDVDLARLLANEKLYTSGSRAFDMAVRFKYENKPVEVIPDLKALIKFIKKNPGNYAVLCTYTAMLQIRKRLAMSRKVRRVK